MERIIVTRRESIVDFFVYAMKNTVLCIRYFLNTKHKSANKKKLDNVFQSNCSSHAELLTNLRKIKKQPKIRHKAVMHPALQLGQMLPVNKMTISINFTFTVWYLLTLCFRFGKINYLDYKATLKSSGNFTRRCWKIWE